MNDLRFRCPHSNCGEKIIYGSSARKKVRITGRVEYTIKGMHTFCYWCGGAVTLPLEMKKANDVPEQERPKAVLVISRNALRESS